MTNPLLDKFYELYPEKKETPKLPKIEDYSPDEPKVIDEMKKVDEYQKIVDYLQSELKPSLTNTTPKGSCITASNSSVTATKTFNTYDNLMMLLKVTELAKQQKAFVKRFEVNTNFPLGAKRVVIEIDVDGF